MIMMPLFRKATIALAICSTLAQADELVTSFGRDKRDVKAIELTYIKPLKGPLTLNAMGLLLAPNLVSSGYNGLAGVSLGYYLEVPWVYASVSQGIGYLSRLERGLDSNLQFITSASGGIKNGAYSLGISWRHLSSGTVRPSNNGREFLGIEFRVNF